MPQPDNVFTINLGKVLISQSQHRAVRAINMIREFARRHMKTQSIKIDEEVAHMIWARGARSPPRKITVQMSKTEDGSILVSPFDITKDATEAEKQDIPEKDSIESKADVASDVKEESKADTIQDKQADVVSDVKADTTQDKQADVVSDVKVESKADTIQDKQADVVSDVKADKQADTAKTKPDQSKDDQDK